MAVDEDLDSAGGFFSMWSGFTLTVGRSTAAVLFSLLEWLIRALTKTRE